MKTFLFSTALAGILFFLPFNYLTGKWQSVSPETGTVTTVVFKKDGTFDGFVNNKPFVVGEYSFNDRILSFTDNGCDGKRGVYNVSFFSNNDSLLFDPIEDACEQRKEGMKKLVMGRVKK